MSSSSCMNCNKNSASVVDYITMKGATTPLCADCLNDSISITQDNKVLVLYTPQPHQQTAHRSNTPNLLCLGTRGTGKSQWLRWDAIARCLMYPGFKALLIRRKIVDLRKSHLQDIGAEAKLLGANFRQTTLDVIFDNGSILQFSHCENDKNSIDDYLSSQWDWIGFDELSTFELDQFLKISASARSIVSKPYRALIRCASNPLGIGAQWMKAWFVDKEVDYAEFPDYLPQRYQTLQSSLADNLYIDRKEYEQTLGNLPEHVRKAWLYGEFVIEGAYFTDFSKKVHCIDTLPTWQGNPLEALDWLKIYRAVDWGYHPDPAVCLWIMVLPNKRAIVFRELTRRKTLAADFAKEVKQLSKGMKIVDTFCDPTMFVKHGESRYSIGEIFENNGVPLTPSQNDRVLYGYSIHDHLNTFVEEQHGSNIQRLPMVQIYESGCPQLVRTIPILEMDKNNPEAIADGPDHWAVSLAYFCMGGASASRDPVKGSKPRWMLPKGRPRFIGSV